MLNKWDSIDHRPGEIEKHLKSYYAVFHDGGYSPMHMAAKGIILTAYLKLSNTMSENGYSVATMIHMSEENIRRDTHIHRAADVESQLSSIKRDRPRGVGENGRW
jgi:hypothetical protein